ncbi:MAG: hypothetical protein PHC93_04995 [Candidatus Omnitrophica bacterium]|nr:hypothetical protein [Candidatus Omnitrophota bacterium]
MTEHAIDTALDCSNHPKEIIVVETCPEDKCPKYERATKTIYPNIEFNYNKFLNLAVKQAKGKYLAFCNNDLSFGKNWDVILINEMKKNNIQSASPFSFIKCGHKSPYNSDSGNVEGYKIGFEFLGWCYVMTRELYDRLGSFDETYKFWRSDFVVTEQLKKINVPHYLICSSDVVHKESGSQTLKSLSKDLQTELTHGQIELYKKNNNL